MHAMNPIVAPSDRDRSQSCVIVAATVMYGFASSNIKHEMSDALETEKPLAECPIACRKVRLEC